MVEGRERIPAAVVLIIFLIGGIVVYLITLPQPVAYKLIFGNFSNSTSVNNTGSNSPPPGAFYYPITSYIGGNPSEVNSTYSLGTFGTVFNEYNSTLSNANSFTLTSSIFGSSSYNIGFNGTTSDTYFLTMYISSVSGSPKLSVSINGNYFYNEIPTNEVVVLKVPSVDKGKNVVSIYNNLNGFAFTQSISFSNVSITQMYSNNASHYANVTAVTLSGIGNYYLQFTPIGYGNLTVLVDNYQMEQITASNDNPTTLLIPANIVNSAIKTKSSAVIPITFTVGFLVSQKSTYEIANAALVYSLPQITESNMTIPYSVKTTTGEYVLTFDVDNILEQGEVTFRLYPSGQTYQIPATNLVAGENIIIIPNNALAGNPVNGNYTGTVSISTDGLVIPEYLSLKPTS